MTVWDNLVGQRVAAAALRHRRRRPRHEPRLALHRSARAPAAPTPRSPSPPRSSASRQGCGTCHECRTVLKGSHADVNVIRTEKLSIGVDEVRDLVRRAALAPVGRRWQIMIVEDADRLTDQACNALLKAIEEPTARTVWMLCAPTVEDVLPTIRSRCRLVTLTTPSTADVAAFLVRTDGVAEGARVVRRPRQPGPHRPGPGAGPRRGDPQPAPRGRDHPGEADHPRRLHERRLQPPRGDQGGGRPDHRRARRPREVRPRRGVRRGRARPPAARVRSRAVRDGEGPEDPGQATPPRRRRPQPDGPRVGLPRRRSRSRSGAPGALVNEEIRPDVDQVVRTATPELNLRRIGWIFDAREQMLEFNVPVPLALESMMLALKVPEGADR